MVIIIAILWNSIYDTFQIGIDLLKSSVQSDFMSKET